MESTSITLSVASIFPNFCGRIMALESEILVSVGVSVCDISKILTVFAETSLKGVLSLADAVVKMLGGEVTELYSCGKIWDLLSLFSW